MPSLKRIAPLAVLLAAGVLQVAPAAASSTQEAILQDDAQIKSDPVGTLATMRSLGVSRVRVTLNWDSVTRSPSSTKRPAGFDSRNQAQYNWSIYDTIDNFANADGIGVYFVLTGNAPLWATGGGMPRGGPFAQWKPSAREFGNFVHAAGVHFDGHHGVPRVNFWSIWNEPNFGFDLAPQATQGDRVEVSAPEYRSLLDAAWSNLLGTGHRPGRDTILIGETAPRGVDHPIGNFSGVKPLRFLRALYCVDSRYRQLRGVAAAERGCPTTAAGSRRFRAAHPGLFRASGFADHPYASQSNPGPPNRPTSLNPHSRRSDPDFADLPEVGRLEGVLDRLNRIYGSRTRYKIWNTEYAYRTRPPDPHAGVSQATAALYINWGEFLMWRQRRLVSYDQYLLRDPSTGEFASGLELPNGHPKADFGAYRMPLYLPVTSTRRGRRLEVWGDVRPAHFNPGSAPVAIQFQSGSRGVFRTLVKLQVRNVRGYIDTRVKFPGSGSVRLAWADPALGHVIVSRTVKIRIR